MNGEFLRTLVVLLNSCSQYRRFLPESCIGGQQIRFQRDILKARTELGKADGVKPGCEAEPSFFSLAASNYLPGVRRNHISFCGHFLSSVPWSQGPHL